MSIRLDKRHVFVPDVTQAETSVRLLHTDPNTDILIGPIACIQANSLHIIIQVSGTTDNVIGSLDLDLYAQGTSIFATISLGTALPGGVYFYKHTGFIGSSFRVRAHMLHATSDDYSARLWACARP